MSHIILIQFTSHASLKPKLVSGSHHVNIALGRRFTPLARRLVECIHLLIEVTIIPLSLLTLQLNGLRTPVIEILVPPLKAKGFHAILCPCIHQSLHLELDVINLLCQVGVLESLHSVLIWVASV